MQTPYIPTRTEADGNLDRFYDHLGHRSLARQYADAPRLSGRPAHADLAASVRRLRKANPAAAIVRPIPTRMRYRIARRRFLNACDRLFTVACSAAIIGIGGYVIVPAIVTAAGSAWR